MCYSAEGRHGPRSSVMRYYARFSAMSHLRRVSTLRQAGKTPAPLVRAHIYYVHQRTPAHIRLPTHLHENRACTVARLSHSRRARAGRRPARAESSRRDLSFSPFRLPFLAPGKVMSGVHWAPIDKDRRSSTFLSLVSPPPVHWARARDLHGAATRARRWRNHVSVRASSAPPVRTSRDPFRYSLLLSARVLHGCAASF